MNDLEGRLNNFKEKTKFTSKLILDYPEYVLLKSKENYYNIVEETKKLPKNSYLLKNLLPFLTEYMGILSIGSTLGNPAIGVTASTGVMGIRMFETMIPLLLRKENGKLNPVVFKDMKDYDVSDIEGFDLIEAYTNK